MAAGAETEGSESGPPSGGPAAAPSLEQAVALQRAGRVDEALAAYSALLAAEPGNLHGWVNLGVALRGAGRLEAAVAAYRRALLIAPDDAGIHSNLGNALAQLGRHDAALAAQERAVALDPANRAAAYNLALLLRDLGRWRDALAELDRCLEGGPDRPELRLDRATALLALGDYPAGFRGFEARLDLPDAAPDNSPAPPWDGGPLDGRSILVQIEPGPRDTLTFLRYVPALAARGARVTVAAPATMAQMVAAIPGVALVVPAGRPAPATELRVPLNSLPLLFATQIDDVPAEFPYLRVPPGRPARRWVDAGEDGALKIGIVWADRRRNPATDRGIAARHCPFEHFLELAALPGVALYSLQTGPSAEERDRLGVPALVRDLAFPIADLADAAEAVAALDLVLGVDSAVMLLAGAMGRPGFVLLPPGADWRWRGPGDASPWFPTLRPFWQEAPGAWDAVFARVAQAVLDLRGGPDSGAANVEPPEASSPPPPPPPSPTAAVPLPVDAAEADEMPGAAAPVDEPPPALTLTPAPPPAEVPPPAEAAITDDGLVVRAARSAEPTPSPSPTSEPAAEDAGADASRAVARFLRRHLRPDDLLVSVGSGIEGPVTALALRRPGSVNAIAIGTDAAMLAALRMVAERAGAKSTVETVEASLGAKAVPARPGAPPQHTLDGLLGGRGDLADRRIVLYLGDGLRLPEIVAGALDLLAQRRIAAILWAPEDGAVSANWGAVLASLAQLGFRHRRLEDGAAVPFEPGAAAATVFSLAPGFAPDAA